MWDAGAEIQDRVNQKLSARQWKDPKKTVTKDIPSYQHTGKGPCQTESERKMFGKFFVYVWGTASMFSSLMMSIFPNVFQPCSSSSVDLEESALGGTMRSGPRGHVCGLAEQRSSVRAAGDFSMRLRSHRVVALQSALEYFSRIAHSGDSIPPLRHF